MARSRSPTKSKSTAAVVVIDDSKSSVDASVSTTITTTTTVTVVDETVASLTVAASSSEKKKVAKKNKEEGKRELPIFNNPLLADDKSSAVTLKPKSGRVKVQGGKTATIAVLKMSAPKTDGEVVVMRRMDSNLVNASLMFQAAYPAVTEEWIAKENSYLTENYEPRGAVVENSESGALAGVWVTISQAKELANEYGIEQFMLPLLNAPARKNTIKATPASSSPSTEIVAKEEKETVEEIVVATAAVVVEKVAVTSEETVVVEEKTEVLIDEKTVETLEVKGVETNEEKFEVEEKNNEEQVQEQEQEQSTGSKRGREEDEEQAEKDRKRFRGFVTVAVGLVAVAATIPQVLPYFS
ncbi:hypothetical protein BGZ95_009588 [Linnemannia exigua]|uniref:HTH APSES-type domain-containing protein n=1 Tax=Linnemannia exigua TaxID=604196 RepID=A0AAD4H6I7_9FUNG|nr:hypothetical protein BGZ95_009588 [Linnemannia exigua]